MIRRALCRSLPSAAAAAGLLALLAGAGRAQTLLPPDPQAAVGRTVPFDGWIDERGQSLAALVAAADAQADPRPWVVSPIYTHCPSTCSPITAALQTALRGSGLLPSDYRVVSLSFDPDETADSLAAFRARLRLAPEWLTVRAGDRTALEATLRALDVRTVTRDDGGFDHPNLIVVLGADRKLVGYVFGVAPAAAELSALLSRARGGAASASRSAGLFGAAALGLALSAGVFVALLSRRRRLGAAAPLPSVRGAG